MKSTGAGEAPPDYSPNQLDKRRRIVDGAKALLLREGLQACTTRAIAQETGFSAGQIHYYFEGVGEIVDAAMLDYLDEIVERVRAVDTSQESGERLVSVIEAHAALFHETPGLLLAWLEYLTKVTRSRELAPMVHVYDQLLDAFTDTLRQTGVSDPRGRAQLLLAASIGLLIGNELRPQSGEARHAKLLSLIDDATP